MKTTCPICPEMRSTNRGRPHCGFEWVEPDMSTRYKTKNFKMRPTKQALELFRRNENGESTQRLADELGWPKTNVKRLVRNVRAWAEAEAN